MPVQLTTPMASVTVTSVGENSVTTTIANSSAGSTWKNSVIFISTASTLPISSNPAVSRSASASAALPSRRG